MTENVVDLSTFRLNRSVDGEDEDWKNHVLEYLDGVKERVQSGETGRIVLIEILQDEVNTRTSLLGMDDMAVFQLVGLMESVKLDLLLN